MIKYILFSLLAGITSIAQSQIVDLSCVFVSYESGEYVDENPMDGSIIITNEGDLIPLGDTITFGFMISGSRYSLNLEPDYHNYYRLSEDFEPGAFLTFGSSELEWAHTGMEVECCATVFGIGVAAVPDFEGDADVSNNYSCITYKLPNVDVSIGEITKADQWQVYAANDRLFIANEGFDTVEPINMSILSMNGREVQSGNIQLVNGVNAIALSEFAQGIYIVRLEINGVISTHKISIR